MITSIIVHAGLVLLFCVLGGFLFCGKGAFLIAGYNTSSPQEKTKYDQKALCRAVATMMFALAFCFFLQGAAIMLESDILLWISFILIFVIVVFGIIYINTAKRIRRK